MILLPECPLLHLFRWHMNERFIATVDSIGFSIMGVSWVR